MPPLLQVHSGNGVFGVKEKAADALVINVVNTLLATIAYRPYHEVFALAPALDTASCVHPPRVSGADPECAAQQTHLVLPGYLLVIQDLLTRSIP